MLLNLIGAMARQGISTETVADLLGLTQRQVHNRLYGYGEFTLSQSLQIYDAYFTDCDFRSLFATKE